MKRTALFIIPVILLFNNCALEIANVIGPGGGYVFYDKGNYDGGWRYIECSQFDMGELKDASSNNILKAMKICKDHSGGWQSSPWELPDEAQMKKMLECFSYGLTQFSPDFYYLSIDSKEGRESEFDKIDPDNPSTWEWRGKGEPEDPPWEVVILHKNFDKKANGEVEKAPDDFEEVIKVRPIRRF